MNRKTEKFMGHDHDAFIMSLYKAIEMEELPVVLNLYNISDLKEINMADIKSFIMDVRNETGLNMQASVYMCENCGDLHVSFSIDYPDELETPLQ